MTPPDRRRAITWEEIASLLVTVVLSVIVVLVVFGVFALLLLKALGVLR